MVSEEAAQEAAGLSGVEPDARHVPGSNVGTGNISGIYSLLKLLHDAYHAIPEQSLVSHKTVCTGKDLVCPFLCCHASLRAPRPCKQTGMHSV